MTLDPQLATAAALTMASGYTMYVAGIKKHVLEWRRRRRTCPSCGRLLDGAGCSCLD